MSQVPLRKTNLPECPVDGYVLREADEGDVAAIFGVESRCMKSQVEQYYPGEWDEKRIEVLIRDNLSRARVLLANGTTVGLYYWEQDEDAVAVLLAVIVLPEHRGLGLGTWLVACFESEAAASGASRAGLAVFRESRAARLYEKLGYRVTGQDGPAALTMEKDLAPKT